MHKISMGLLLLPVFRKKKTILMTKPPIKMSRMIKYVKKT